MWPSPPLAFSCITCNWKHIVPHAIGDCRIPGFDHFDSCPNCGGKVVSQRAGALDILGAKLGQVLKRKR